MPQPGPRETQHAAARVQPAGGAVMYQQWRDLLFLHWEYPAAAIQETLPEGLFVDTFGGTAYLGIVPFFMRNSRPRFLPAVPGLSNFMELNLRTYVYDRSGIPGVWFYSLDANQPLAVEIARRIFHLPYRHAKMRSNRTVNGSIHYESTRIGAEAKGATCIFEYLPGTELSTAEAGSLEFFLIERYHLYASAGGALWRGTVIHNPYPLRRAEVTVWGKQFLTLNSFTSPGRPPDHSIMSRGVDVAISPLEQVRKVSDPQLVEMPNPRHLGPEHPG